MPYGTIKVDNITFTNGGSDSTITVSGIVEAISGNITATGTIQGATIIGTSTVSGATVTGNTASFTSGTFVSGIFTTQISGATITGNTGNFTTFNAGTANLTSGVFASGTQGAPSLSIGTTTNGLYSPGADQVAISTNGSGRLFVDASGNVGVNTAPQAPLHVLGSILSQTGNLVFDDTGGAYVSAQGGLTSPLILNGRGDVRFTTGGTPTGGTERLRITSTGTVNIVGAGSAGSTQAVSFNGSAPINSLVLTSGGRVGIGTASPSQLLHVEGNALLNGASKSLQIGSSGANWLYFAATSGGSELSHNNNAFQLITSQVDGITFSTNGTNERLRITSAGLVGVGTTPDSPLHVVGTSGTGLRIGYTNNTNYFDANTQIFRSNNATTTYGQWDSSGRLLVGTSSSRSDLVGLSPQIQLEGATQSATSLSLTRNEATSAGPALLLAKSRGTTAGAATVVQSGDTLGGVYFMGADGTNIEIGAQITGEVDATPGNNDLPSRLVFSTTADGASSPTERMRITNGGGVRIAQDITDDPGASNITGIGFGPSGFASLSRTQGVSLFVNRTTDDGGLAIFRQDGTDEGSITVSGTTVSYNGAHLSRWSQLPSGAERTEILRGTVLSNIDEMCAWGEEDNEQLNRMKVSDVEGDKNVSGVFQAWDDDDDTYTNDFYCAMTGDFIIRIAAGVTVERGDLLMSAGDGTAKPQDDDIIRSKTIAKVTSTNVSCTYPDGSYCVPCVLMAC